MYLPQQKEIEQSKIYNKTKKKNSNLQSATKLLKFGSKGFSHEAFEGLSFHLQDLLHGFGQVAQGLFGQPAMSVKHVKLALKEVIHAQCPTRIKTASGTVQRRNCHIWICWVYMMVYV